MAAWLCKETNAIISSLIARNLFGRATNPDCREHAPLERYPKVQLPDACTVYSQVGLQGWTKKQTRIKWFFDWGVQNFFQIRTGLQLQNWVCWRKLRPAAMLVQSQRNFVSRKQIPTAAMPALHFNVCPTPANPAQRKKYRQKSSTPGGVCVGGVWPSLRSILCLGAMG